MNRIVYIIQSSSINMLEDRAAPVHIYHVIRELQKLGHHVQFITPQRFQVVFTDNLPQMRENGQIGPHIRSLAVTSSVPFVILEKIIRRLQRILKIPYFSIFDAMRLYEGIFCAEQLDIIYERYNLLACAGALAARQRKISYIVEVNGDMLAEYDFLGESVTGFRRRFATWAAKLSYRMADAIITPSQGLAQHLSIQWQISPDKIHVISNAADIDAYHLEQGFDWRARLGLKPEDLVIIYVGGFYRWHDLGTLVEAFAQVASHVSAARLVLVGDGRERQPLELQIEELGLKDRVVFTGTVPHTDVPGLICLSDICVYSGQEKGWGVAPLKLFEYMAAAKPIVASNVEGIGKFVIHRESALLVKPGDAQAMAGAFEELLNDEPLRKKLGKQAYLLVTQKHSWRIHAGDIQKVFELVLEARKGR
jgi:glycosyltransferase involved in cell wall biosynthesis